MTAGAADGHSQECLTDGADDIAAKIRKARTDPGELPGPEALTAFLAFSLACTYAPLNRALTEAELVFEFEDLPAKALVVMRGVGEGLDRCARDGYEIRRDHLAAFIRKRAEHQYCRREHVTADDEDLVPAESGEGTVAGPVEHRQCRRRGARCRLMRRLREARPSARV